MFCPDLVGAHLAEQLHHAQVSAPIITINSITYYYYVYYYY